jgi:hypothetical protein
MYYWTVYQCTLFVNPFYVPRIISHLGLLNLLPSCYSFIPPLLHLLLLVLHCLQLLLLLLFHTNCQYCSSSSSSSSSSSTKEEEDCNCFNFSNRNFNMNFILCSVCSLSKIKCSLVRRSTSFVTACSVILRD